MIIGAFLLRRKRGKKELFSAIIMQLGIVLVTGSVCLAIFLNLPEAAADIFSSLGGVCVLAGTVLSSVSLGFRAIEPLGDYANYKYILIIAAVIGVAGLFLL